MSWTGNINELKEKYWSGETTLEEERLLKEHFATSQNDDLEGLYFQYLDEQKAVVFTPSEKRRPGIIVMLKRRIPAIAAGLAILLASVLVINQNRSRNEANIYVAQTPEEALMITQKAFAFINNEVNNGNQKVRNNLNEFDKILFFN